jgi:hypothetical protein
MQPLVNKIMNEDGYLRLMETARTSETLVNFYQTTRRYNIRRQPSSYSPPCEPQILEGNESRGSIKDG